MGNDKRKKCVSGSSSDHSSVGVALFFSIDRLFFHGDSWRVYPPVRDP